LLWSLSNRQLQSFTPEQVSQLTPAQLSSVVPLLSPPQLSALNRNQMPRGTVNQALNTSP
jgi:hypothetical protein